MSQVITIINMKGGVGKTTLSVNISYILARYHHKKVLVVDIDPQFNATQYLVTQPVIINHFTTKKTVFDILMPVKEDSVSLSSSRRDSVANSTNLSDYLINVKRFDIGYLDLIPSSLKLINFETSKRGVENLLKKFLEEKCSHYDYIIIDCPPTLSLLTLSAYLASDHYLIPIKPDYLSSLGLPLLDRGLREYEDLHDHSLNLLGVVFTMVSANRVSDEIMQSVQEESWECFQGYSSHSTRVAQSVKSLDNFYRYAKFARYAAEFKAITQELVNKL